MKAKVSLKTVIVSVLLLVCGLNASADNKSNLVYNSEEVNGMEAAETVYKMDGNTLASYIKYNYKYDDNKRMTESENSSSIAFYFALLSAAAGLLTWPFGWVSLSAEALGWLCLAGLAGGAGHITANEAIARAPVSALAPFDFTGLVWALGFDILIFSQWPGPLGLLGVCAITGAALLVTFQKTSLDPRPKP